MELTHLQIIDGCILDETWCYRHQHPLGNELQVKKDNLVTVELCMEWVRKKR